jgi:hypothetical protein
MQPVPVRVLTDLTDTWDDETRKRVRVAVFAKDQPQYFLLPALIFEDGKILTEWTLTEEERQRLIRGEALRLWVWTFNQPLQPVMLEVTSEEPCPREV